MTLITVPTAMLCIISFLFGATLVALYVEHWTSPLLRTLLVIQCLAGAFELWVMNK